MANFIYIQEGTEKVTLTCIILPVSGMHNDYWLSQGHFHVHILIVKKRLVLKMCCGGLFQRPKACPLEHL